MSLVVLYSASERRCWLVHLSDEMAHGTSAQFTTNGVYRTKRTR
jgi:hypothetical protein